MAQGAHTVSYNHIQAQEHVLDHDCRLLLEKKNNQPVTGHGEVSKNAGDAAITEREFSRTTADDD
ncbi:hypothetical protein, partial [Klebsiella aerogenes]|uniref:hypothetical protein n=1 Tax=Klebsiella aerogenes TaxID=548 RepID=UPI001CE39A36